MEQGRCVIVITVTIGRLVWLTPGWYKESNASSSTCVYNALTMSRVQKGVFVCVCVCVCVRERERERGRHNFTMYVF